MEMTVEHEEIMKFILFLGGWESFVCTAADVADFCGQSDLATYIRTSVVILTEDY